MKTITMDFDTYTAELKRERHEGHYEACCDFKIAIIAAFSHNKPTEAWYKIYEMYSSKDAELITRLLGIPTPAEELK